MRLLIIIIHTATHLWNYMAGIMAGEGAGNINCFQARLDSKQFWEIKEYFSNIILTSLSSDNISQ